MFNLIIALPGGTIIVKGLSMFLLQNLGLSGVQLSYNNVLAALQCGRRFHTACTVLI